MISPSELPQFNQEDANFPYFHPRVILQVKFEAIAYA
jgi:hypothetical protein